MNTLEARLHILTIVLSFSTAIAAEPAPEDAAKYRQSIMKALSGHNGAIRLIVGGKAGDSAKLASHIEALEDLTSEVGAVFQEGSDLEDDETLPAIWENPDEFASAVSKLEEAVGTLAGTAGSGDMEAVDAAHREMGKACKGCHEEFRVDN